MSFFCMQTQNSRKPTWCGTKHRTIEAARRCKGGIAGIFDSYECNIVDDAGNVHARFMNQDRYAQESDRKTISISGRWIEVPVNSETAPTEA